MTNIMPSTMKKKNKKRLVKTFPHPVDSGWSWMVLLATFTIFVTFGGILRSFGIYMVEFLSVYGTNSTVSALVIGLQFASSGVGAIVGMTIGFKYFSPRQIIMSGGLIGSVGLMINTFADSIYFFIFSHSILVGLSIGLMNGPCLFSLGKYFDKRRSLANGINMGGVSFGGLIMGPISRYLIDTYGLKGAFLIIGAIHLHTIVAGALIRPETFYQVVIKKRQRQISDNSTQERNTEQRTRKISDPKKPEAKALLGENNEQLDGIRPRSPTGDSFSPLARKAMLQRMRSRTESEVLNIDLDPNLVVTVSNSQGTIPEKPPTNRKPGYCYISNEYLFDISTAEIIRLSLSQENIHASNGGVSSHVKKKQNSFKKLLHVLCDATIFKNTAFVIFFISYLVGSIGCLYPIMFLPVLADFHGISKTQQSLLVSISSAVDVFGRTTSGIIGDRGFISRKHIMVFALTICGFINCLNFLYTDFWSLTIFAVIYGLIGGTLFAINSSTLSEIVEGEKFGPAIGLMTGGQQIILGLAGPLTGALRDLTGTYAATFYFFGAGNLIAACLLSIDTIYLYFKKAPTASPSVEVEMS